MVNDLVSREEVLKALHRNEQYAKSFGYHSVFQTVLEVPAVKQKLGKWIKTGRWGRVYKCNQCGNFLDFDGVNVGRGSTNFCPNCGARMENSNE